MIIKYNDCVIDAIRRNKGGYVKEYYPYHPVTGNFTSKDVNLFKVLK